MKVINLAVIVIIIISATNSQIISKTRCPIKESMRNFNISSVSNKVMMIRLQYPAYIEF